MKTSLLTETGEAVAGVAVKLREIKYWIEIGCGGPEQELIPSALKDAERLAGEAGDEPLVALWGRWRHLEWHKVAPEGLTEDEAESFTDRLADEADAVAMQIIAAPAKTLIGAYAQIALIKSWADIDAPRRAEAALARLHGSVETALQDAAKGGAA